MRRTSAARLGGDDDDGDDDVVVAVNFGDVLVVTVGFGAVAAAVAAAGGRPVMLASRARRRSGSILCRGVDANVRRHMREALLPILIGTFIVDAFSVGGEGRWRGRRGRLGGRRRRWNTPSLGKFDAKT
jgi:hypothetical protein